MGHWVGNRERGVILRRGYEGVIWIEKGVRETIEKTQKEFKSDIFGFGYLFAGSFNTIQEWESYNWFKHYPEAKVNVEVEFNIRRTGLMYGSGPVMDKDVD